MEAISKAEILGLIRNKIGYNYSQKQMASDVGVSPAYVSEVLAGRKEPTEKFLKFLGVEKVVTMSFVIKDA